MRGRSTSIALLGAVRHGRRILMRVRGVLGDTFLLQDLGGGQIQLYIGQSYMMFLYACCSCGLLHDIWRRRHRLRAFSAISSARRLYRVRGLRRGKVIVVA